MYLKIALIVIIIINVFLIRNSFVKHKLQVDNAFSAMDVFLKKRYDLIPNLVAAVKSYATHEEDTFIKTTEARAKAMASNNTKDIVKENNSIEEYVSKIFIIAENYPELKASENYRKLNSQMMELESQIADARLYYNGCVTKYNSHVEKFPTNLFAKLFGYKTIDLYAIDEQSRSSVHVDM